MEPGGGRGAPPEETQPPSDEAPRDEYGFNIEARTEDPLGISEATQAPATTNPLGTSQVTQAPLGATPASRDFLGASQATLDPLSVSQATQPPRGAALGTRVPFSDSAATLEPLDASRATLPPWGASHGPLSASQATLDPLYASQATLPPVGATGATRASYGPLSASQATLDPLYASQATLPPVGATGATRASYGPLSASQATLDPLYASQATLPPVSATGATMDQLGASQATIDPLSASQATLDPRSTTPQGVNAFAAPRPFGDLSRAAGITREAKATSQTDPAAATQAKAPPLFTPQLAAASPQATHPPMQTPTLPKAAPKAEVPLTHTPPAAAASPQEKGAPSLQAQPFMPVVSKAEAPTASAPKYEAPQVDSLTTKALKAQAPQTEAPKVENAKAEAVPAQQPAYLLELNFPEHPTSQLAMDDPWKKMACYNMHDMHCVVKDNGDGFPEILDYDDRKMSTMRVFCVLTGTVLYNRVLWAETSILAVVYFSVLLFVLPFRFRGFSDFMGSESDIQAFISMFTTLIGLLLSFYTSLNLKRWWEMRMIGVEKIQQGSAELTMLLAAGVLHDRQLISTVQRYAVASLMLLFMRQRGQRNQLHKLAEASVLTWDEVDKLSKVPDDVRRAKAVWTWVHHLVANLNKQGLMSGPPHYCRVIAAADMARLGVCQIALYLNTPIPMPYVHLLGLMVKLHNFLLTVLMALCSVAFIGRSSGKNMDEIALARTLITAFLMPFLYNAILVVNIDLTDPFSGDMTDLPLSQLLETIKTDSSSYLTASEHMPTWMSSGRKFDKLEVP